MRQKLTDKAKIDMGVYKDNFTSEAIHELSDIIPASSAASGSLDPSDIAKYYLGFKFNVGDIAAYCLRRFGHSAANWDSDKGLYRWIVTTPMKGLWLSIQPCTVSPFGYVIKKEQSNLLQNVQDAEKYKWAKSFRKWAKQEHKVTLVSFMWGGDSTENEINEQFNIWFKKNYSLIYDPEKTFEELIEAAKTTGDKIGRDFYNFKNTEHKKLMKIYEQEHPFPNNQHMNFSHRKISHLEISLNHTAYYFRRIFHGKFIRTFFYYCSGKIGNKYDKKYYIKPFWHTLTNDNLVKQANEAIYRTLQDLLRPVRVRDWEVHITDNIHPDISFCEWDEDNDKTIYDYYAPSSVNAGYGAELTVLNNQSWREIKAILRKDYGSIENGLPELLKKLELK